MARSTKQSGRPPEDSSGDKRILELEASLRERTRNLEYANHQLIALTKLSGHFSQIHDEHLLFEDVPRLLTQALDFDRASLVLWEDQKPRVYSFWFQHDSPEVVDSFQLIAEDPASSAPPAILECYESGKTIFIPDIENDSRWQSGSTIPPNLRAMVLAPVKVKNKPIAVIVANMEHHQRNMDEQDVARFEMFANVVGLAVENIRSYQSMEQLVEKRTQSLREANEALKAKAQELERKTMSLGMANLDLFAMKEELELKNEQVRKADQLLRSIVESSPIPLVVSRKSDGQILYVNEPISGIMGVPAAELIGENASRFYADPEDRARSLKLIEQQGFLRDREIKMRRPNGDELWMIFSMQPAMYDGEEVFVSGLYDITQRRNAEEALRESTLALETANRELRETHSQLVQSEKMASLGMLVAGIAHEINTPVGAINSMYDTQNRALQKLRALFEEQFPGAVEENRKLAATIRIMDDTMRVIASGSERVTEIVKRLRSFARLDEAELKEADIHEGLDDTLVLIHHEIKHRLTTHKEYGTVRPIACFPGKLNQVFLNLLMNASQAIKENGDVTIRTRQAGGYVHISIADNGVGIPPANLQKIFDPGFTTKGVGVGTGLGLSIVYRIITEDHHGKIRVESEVGKGTTFFISVPDDLDRRLEYT